VAERKLAMAHKALMETRGLQFDFQGAPPPQPPPGWLMSLVRALGELAPLLKYLFWGGLVVGVALIAWLFAREVLAMRRRRRAPPQEPVDWRPEPEVARALLDDADRLAGAGRFDEAIHLLLFRSIDDVAGRRPGTVRPALTSRDIARLETMPAGPRRAFGEIAEAVERSFFGGRPAGPDDFTRCRRGYEAFAFAEDWA
jgi:hypothetical protein